tara:strand:- start:6685 stop:9063 length:2379 start_codon:yes stop_codon:yes gene_type:complete
MATPKVTRTLFDNNLDRTTPQGPQNRSVVILGTGTDGPMYEAVKVSSSADAADVFGAFGDGTLVRGIKECFDAQAGSQAAPNVWGMRIGGTVATRALLDLNDASSVKVIRIEALYDGSTYNGIFLKKDVDANDGNTYIYLWNPKTQLFSKFSADLNNSELVAAINADPNASSVVFATEEEFTDTIETEINTALAEGGQSATGLTVDLNQSDGGADSQIEGAGIQEVTSIYTVSNSTAVSMAKGSSVFKLSDSSLPDFIGSGTNFSGIVGNTVDVSVDEDSGTQVTLAAAGGDIDLSFAVDTNYVANATYTTATIKATINGTTTFDTIADKTVVVSGGTATTTAQFTHDDLIGLSNLDAGDVVDISVQWDITGVSVVADPDNTSPVGNNNYAVNVTGNGIYGNQISFGAALPYTITFKYARLKYYEVGSSAVITNATTGAFELTDPGYDHANQSTFWFGLHYKYIGDDPNWTTGSPEYLQGGANGAVLTNGQLKADLDVAYDSFVVDNFDVMSVVDVTMDAKLEDGTYAGFGKQMSDFLDTFNGEMIGVIGFEPLVGSGVGGRVQRADVADRVKHLTVPDSINGNAAFLLSDFHQPFMYAVDIEGIFSANGVRYTAISTSAVSGLIASMPTEEAIFRFTVPGIQGMRYRYTEKDVASGSRQIDVLSDARIATGMIDGGVKITESRTLASAGSDFENLMTVLILQEVLQICRSVAKDYIGKVSSAPLLQAFQSSLDKQIGDALVPRVLRGFRAPISMTPGERVLGTITIPLTISPQFEIRDVHYNVQLTAEDIV